MGGRGARAALVGIPDNAPSRVGAERRGGARAALTPGEPSHSTLVL